jgi:hypothetical protein
MVIIRFVFHKGHAIWSWIMGWLYNGICNNLSVILWHSLICGCNRSSRRYPYIFILSVVFDLWLLMNPLVSRIMCHRITLYIEWCASLRCSDRMIVKFTSISVYIAVKSTRSDEDSDEMSSIKHYIIQFSTYIRVIYMDIVCCFGCIDRNVRQSLLCVVCLSKGHLDRMLMSIMVFFSHSFV